MSIAKIQELRDSVMKNIEAFQEQWNGLYEKLPTFKTEQEFKAFDFDNKLRQCFNDWAPVLNVDVQEIGRLSNLLPDNEDEEVKKDMLKSITAIDLANDLMESKRILFEKGPKAMEKFLKNAVKKRRSERRASLK